ncbi:MAG: SGNH/GDSL hydrolase family protein [Aquabacterium sp.]|uniref:SGNH/GDSL hydrolase family protein n=1 Tax=Aquabacterium sp. TaxID=1872578 RepID=UPI003BB0CE88
MGAFEDGELVGLQGQDFDDDLIKIPRRQARSNIGTRILMQRCAASATLLGATSHVMMRLAQKFDAVRLVVFNPCASAVTAMKASVSAGGSTAAPLNSGGAWKGVTWAGGAGTVNLPLTADAQNPSITLSDWIDVEGDDSRLLSVRIYVPAGGNVEHPIHSASVVAANMENYPDREWIMKNQVGDFVGAPAGMNSAGSINVGMVAGVQYMARGEVLSVFGFGDSIMQGFGSASGVDSHALKGVASVAGETGAAIEFANMGWQSQTTAQTLARLSAAVPLLKPHAVIYAAFSPNDGDPDAAKAAAQKARLARARAACADVGATLVPVTGLPVNVSAVASKYSDGADDMRKSVNDVVRALDNAVDIDVEVADTTRPGKASRFRTVAAGFPVDYTTDFLHPTDAGYAAGAPKIARALRKLL